MHTELETMVYSKASSAASTTTATTAAATATTTNAAASIAISSLPKSTSTTMSEQEVTIHNLSIEQVIKDKLALMVQEKMDPDQGSAFFVGDLGEVYRQHLRWKAHLPRIEPFFGEQLVYDLLLAAAIIVCRSLLGITGNH